MSRLEPRHDDLLMRFVHALENGDVPAMQGTLAAAAVLYTDGGGKVRAARYPLVGAAKIAHYLGAWATRMTVRDVRLMDINGRPAAFLRFGRQQQVVAIDVIDGLIGEVQTIMNPDKLRYLIRQLDDRS